MRRSLQSPFIAFPLIVGLVFILTCGLRLAGGLESLELDAYDWFIQLRHSVSAPDPRIFMVTISEEDIRNQGRWPISDAVLARVLEILSQCNPRAIGLDIFRDIAVPPGFEGLSAVLSRNVQIIGVMKFGEEGVPPPPALRNTDRVGFNDILVDPGGVVRRALLFLDDGKNVFYSFPFRLALLYLKPEGIIPTSDPAHAQYLRLGKTTIRPFEQDDGGYVRADARGYQFLLDFKGFPRSFPSYSLTEILSGMIDGALMKDKIVLIGVVAQSTKDFFHIPFKKGFQGGEPVSGLELHAYTTSQILGFALGQGLPIRTIKESHELLWLFLWTIMGGVIGLLSRSPWRFAAWCGTGVLVLGLAAYYAFLKNWWIPLVPPGMAWLVSATLVTAYVSSRERKERAFLMQLFSKSVSKEVAETLWQQREQFLDGGRPRSQKLVVTTLFSDLRGFTSVSEKMDPKDLTDWLNTYMESMTQIVMDHSGIVDDYAGDGLKADFGVPVARILDAEIRQDAINAVRCALAMEKELLRLNVQWQARGLPPVGMRIGIFTGPAVVGLLGSSQRMKYTTIGDAINTASRLESYDKELAKDALCRILIGETTSSYVIDHFNTEKVGETSLRGKTEKVAVYRVLGEKQSEAPGTGSGTSQDD